ncbi:MAG: ester cyclase [Kutzneria sp.]|nr:ester cyclase [Kutzneria sp.]MBV9845862.1 ester cyclase [Kutzneria sp.]
MTAVRRKQLVRQLYERGMAGESTTELREGFTADYQAKAAGVSFPPGPEAFAMWARLWREAVPDLSVVVDELLADGDIVASSVTYTGTHASAFMGVAATGRRFSVSGVDLHRFRDQTLAESEFADTIPRMLLTVGALVHAPTSSSQWT